MWNSIASSSSKYVRSALLVTGVFLAICILASLSDRRTTDDPGRLSKDLMTQTYAWMDAAAQDGDPLTRWQHLSLAKSYLTVCRHVASDASIERASRTHVRALAKRVESELQKSTAQIHKTCNKLRPNVQVPRDTLPGLATGEGNSRDARDAPLRERTNKHVTWI